MSKKRRLRRCAARKLHEWADRLERERLSSLADTVCSANLLWTTKKPNADGWYWLRYGDSFGWWEGCVEYDTQDNSVFFEGEWREIENIRPNAEWSNKPITEPINS